MVRCLASSSKSGQRAALPRRSRHVPARGSNQRPSGRTRSTAPCGRPQRSHSPPARSKRTCLLSSDQWRGYRGRSSRQIGIYADQHTRPVGVQPLRAALAPVSPRARKESRSSGFLAVNLESSGPASFAEQFVQRNGALGGDRQRRLGQKAPWCMNRRYILSTFRVSGDCGRRRWVTRWRNDCRIAGAPAQRLEAPCHKSSTTAAATKSRWARDELAGIRSGVGTAGEPDGIVVRPGKAGMFSREQTCRGRSQSPVVWIAEEMETEPSKPVEKTSSGEVTSHRAVTKVNALWPRKVVFPRAEPTTIGRRQNEQPEDSPIRLFTLAGWKRQHGDKDMLSNWGA